MKELSLAHAVQVLVENAPPEEIGPMSVSGIARKFHVKPSYLSRSFYKYNDNTLHEHLELYRFVAFRCLVWNMQNPQVEKALKIMNIPNTSHFIRRYKKIPPSWQRLNHTNRPGCITMRLKPPPGPATKRWAP